MAADILALDNGLYAVVGAECKPPPDWREPVPRNVCWVAVRWFVFYNALPDLLAIPDEGIGDPVLMPLPMQIPGDIGLIIRGPSVKQEVAPQLPPHNYCAPIEEIVLTRAAVLKDIGLRLAVRLVAHKEALARIGIEYQPPADLSNQAVSGLFTLFKKLRLRR